MLGALERLTGRRPRRVLIAAIAAGALGATAAPVLAAAPSWQVTMTQANPFGLQLGKDPFTESGETFAQESGWDAYTIAVKNNGNETAGAAYQSGSTLTCVGGPPTGVSLKYRWLRNGQEIAGAEAGTYVLSAEDEGKTVQCEVTATDSEGATAAVSQGAPVKPVPSPPALENGKFVTINPFGKQAVGTPPESCASGSWTGSPTFTYQWLRGGVPISLATAKKYKLVEADVGKAIQCQVLATSAGGASAAVSVGKNGIATAGEAEPTFPKSEAEIPPAVVFDQLPPGLVLTPTKFQKELEALKDWKCTLLAGSPAGGGAYEGLTALRCAAVRTLEEGQSYQPIRVHVHVTPKAESPAVNKVTISGGGAPTPPPTVIETTITPPVQFGIHCFTMSILEKEEEGKHPCEEAKGAGEPIHAGGHPFSEGAEVVLNFTTSDEQGNLVAAGGGSKEVQAELPPGFVGNPQNMPECPLKLLLNNHCPASTAVGYTQASFAIGNIEGGKPNPFHVPPEDREEYNSLVYNMQPSVGHPAEFGFVLIKNVPFLLQAHVRSNGDYGITVGDGAAGEKLLGDRTTFCEFGAHGIGGSYSCNKAAEAPNNAKPFLTNPTECSASAPAWNLTVNAWDEPGNRQSKAAHTPQPVGCEKLVFEPRLEFKPSPASEGGTSQADEPTGMTMNLKVPQTNEPGNPATPALRSLTMELPAGMTVSPSAADGLLACTNAQFGLGVTAEPAQPANCPQASQIGTAEVFTPLLSGAPKIEGVPKVGEVLTCSEGLWSASHSVSYQWLLGGRAGEKLPLKSAVPLTPISGATENEYIPVKEDEGRTLQCQVKASNAAGSSVAVGRAVIVLTNEGGVFSEPTPLPAFPPPGLAPPSGSPVVGKSLSCDKGVWTSPKAHEPEFTYQWLRGGEPIEGATESSYTLKAGDEGKVVQCQVTANNEVISGTTHLVTGGGVVMADSAGVIVTVSPEPSSRPPLPGGALQGQLFLAQPECSPCGNEDAQDGKMLRLFLQIQNPRDGVVIKLHGNTTADPVTGRLKTTFLDQPQQPFELLQLKLKGGPRATLANPLSCGQVESNDELTPWSAATPVALKSPFEVSWDGKGGACPGTLPFNPSFNAGTTGPTATAAGAYSPLSVTFGREDREQLLSGAQVQEPPGLAAKIAGIPLCGEPQANAGTCGPESQIGTTTVGSGPGPQPFFLGGKVYLTGPYKGAPFGLSIVVPAVAGPFNLGTEVVRSAITVDPNTAAVTVTSDPLKQIRAGVPFRLRKVNVNIDRPGFNFNPTNCSPHQITATLTGVPSITATRGASAQVSTPFNIAGCTSLPFKPTLTASTQAETSKANGASLSVKVTSGPGQANIAKTMLILPRSLPSRLTTIQKACRAAVFNANPASCPEGSVIGTATAHTPVLNAPLTGPAYLVSHGSAEFPDVQFLLQGEGVTLVLDGKTNIKKGVTSSTFESVPDAPVSTFETVLPEGPHSALAALGSLCSQSLVIPTTITGQNGAVIVQNTQIAVTGCPSMVSILRISHTANGLLATVRTGAPGTVWLSGYGLKITHRFLKAGTSQVPIAFTKTGRSLHRHHKRTSLRVKLTVGKQAVTATSAVRL